MRSPVLIGQAGKAASAAFARVSLGSRRAGRHHLAGRAPTVLNCTMRELRGRPSEQHQRCLLAAIDAMLAAGLAFVAACVGLDTFGLDTTREADAGIVERRHAALAHFHDALGGDRGMSRLPGRLVLIRL